MKTTTLIALGLSLCTLPLSAQEKTQSPLDNFGRTPLMAAAHLSKADTVKELLAQGADPNEIPPQGRTALMLAAWDNSGECTRLLLEAGAALDVKTTDGKTALDIAVEQGNVAAVKLLLEAGAKPVSATVAEKNETKNCLLRAACSGNQELVDLLLAHGAAADERALIQAAAKGGLHGQLKRMLEKDPDLAHARDNFQRTVLMCAAESGDAECVRMLLQAGVPTNDDAWQNKTALALAAGRGLVEVVRVLLEAGAVNRPRGNHAVSAMQEAVRQGRREVVEVFLGHGVDINDCRPSETTRNFGNSHAKTDTTYLGIAGLTPSISGYSDSAIMNATVFNRNTKAMLEFVLSKGADIELRNGDGTTPLMAAAMLGYRPQVQALLAAGAKVNARDNMGNTALIHAAKSGNAQLVRDLQAAGADTKATNNEGMSPLLYAVLANAPECISALKEAGAKTDAKNYAGHSAAQLAAFGGAKDFLAEALQNGLDVNTCDATGHNLLAYAVMGGQADLIPFLVEKGADVNAKDAEGLTPLMHALLQKKASAPTMPGVPGKPEPDMVAMLLERGADAKAVDNAGATALHYAVLTLATPKQIGELAAAGADVGAKDKDGYDALTLAALFGYKVQLEKLIALGANPDVRDADGRPLLQLVMTRNTVCKCDRLLMLGHIIAKRKPQPALLNGQTLSCRDIACQEFPQLPYNSTGDLLLSNGADPWVRDKDGKLLILRYLNDQGRDQDNVIRSLISAMKNVPDTVSEEEKAVVLSRLMRHKALFRASECHHAKPFPNPVEKLLGLGISPDVTSVDGVTPLAEAAIYGNYPAAKVLLEHGADVNKADAGGCTPLHYAANGKPGEDDSVLKLLLAQPGINVNAQDKECNTPLMEVVVRATPATIQLLLDAGADVTTTDLYDRNLLMWACSNPNPAVFKMLYDLGKIDPKAKDHSRVADTLHYAVLNNRPAVIDLLLPDGVTDAEAKGFYGEQLMVNALRGHCAPVARGLLAHGVDAKTVLGYDQNRTLLHVAAQGCPELIPDLLAAGADPKAVTDHEQTVLMYAIIFGDNKAPARMNAIRALIEAGCDPEAKDDRGKTALDYATSTGHKEQVELLRRYTQSEGK